ncbi:MAG: alpha-ketoglutarate-dependent dioxygenase AlkB [Acidobacteria bacterium]|nr:alpha-ketoglutarate-dependent dioxygenase AlkB [Acidobacteriota bacterium]
MRQLALLVTSETLLVDDERGRIAYVPEFIDADTARDWFAEIREGVDWHAQRRMMYEREVDVPRLVSSFRLDPPAESMPQAILDASRRVIERVGEPFNSVGLNRYRDGRDSVAPHNDHLNEICEGFSIALISLGAARRMSIRAKAGPRRVIHVDLEPGSLFVMSYAAQLHYTHAVPKTPNPVGERISLAFRVKRPRVPTADASPTGIHR